MTSTPDDPPVMGRAPDDDVRGEWMRRFVEHLLVRSVPVEHAVWLLRLHGPSEYDAAAVPEDAADAALEARCPMTEKKTLDALVRQLREAMAAAKEAEDVRLALALDNNHDDDAYDAYQDAFDACDVADKRVAELCSPANLTTLLDALTVLQQEKATDAWHTGWKEAVKRMNEAERETARLRERVKDYQDAVTRRDEIISALQGELAEEKRENLRLQGHKAEYAEYRQLTQQAYGERDAAREALGTVLAKLPHPIWDDHGVLIWSYLDIARVQAALGQPAEPQP